MTLENKHDSQSSFIYRKEKEPEFQKIIKNDVKTGGKESTAALGCCEIRLDDTNSSVAQVLFTL